ncbi:MAG: hypothetical protein B6I18_08390 [Bacteroidetes bacterium 4572_112]|nr:MAG: hypothetical protein B6I18_08390 [Bacteroidetes bacterium 4572_112]
MNFSLKKLKKDFQEQIALEISNKKKLSLTIGFGIFMGIVPAWGFQMLIAFALAQLMKLNKTLVIIAANISVPPLIPFILLGSYWVGGILMSKEGGGPLIQNLKNISDVNLEDFLKDLGSDFTQYILGAFVLAFIMGLLASIITYLILKLRLSIKNK